MDIAASQIFTLGLLLVSGVLAGLVASRFGLPRVAAYVVAGMAFSPGLLGSRLGVAVGGWAAPFTAAALGIIAFLIGSSMTVSQLRRMGRVILGSALGESLGAVLLVFAAVRALSPQVAGISALQLALALSGIAATTAPAATVAVLHQFRARGRFATSLLGVVALDDAFGIVYFSLMLVASVGDSLATSLGRAGLEIGGALALGVATGWIFATFGRRVRQRPLRLPLVLGSILLVVGLAQRWHLSPLLASMALGFCLRHFSRAAGDRLFVSIEYLEELVFVAFFTLAGAHFEMGVFLEHLDLILTYFLARIVGKVAGAAVGARLSGAPDTVVRWLGLGLVPQAGVAVGLALTLSQQPAFREVSGLIVNVILATTLLYELLGPLTTRFALAQAGELGVKRERFGR